MEYQRCCDGTFRVVGTWNKQRIVFDILTNVTHPAGSDVARNAVSLRVSIELPVCRILIDPNTQQGHEIAGCVFKQPNLNDFEIQQIVQVVPNVLFQQINSLIHFHHEDFSGPQIG